MSRFIDPALFALYTIASVAGVTLIKAYIGIAQPRIVALDLVSKPVILTAVGAGLYIMSFSLWLVILGRVQLSLAYPIAIGLTLVLSTLSAGMLLGEILPLARLIGIGIVLLGVCIVART